MTIDRHLLQLFAEGEPGGEAAPAAAPDPGAEAPEAREQQALQEGFRAHFQELERQGQALQGTFPGFDLRRELRDPLFARLTSPSVGLSVEDAYYTVHRRQIQAAAMEAAARNTAVQVSNAVRSGSLRPRENGTTGQAPSVSSFDYRRATAEQRQELKRQIRLASAQGRKLYPGQR